MAVSAGSNIERICPQMTEADIESTAMVGGVRLVGLDAIVEPRGTLHVLEHGARWPFVAQRFFVVSGVGPGVIRGDHAHRRGDELLVCVAGSVRVEFTDGSRRASIPLDDPAVALMVPPLVWAVQYDHAPGTVLLALCSLPYDPDNYVTDPDEFVALCS